LGGRPVLRGRGLAKTYSRGAETVHALRDVDVNVCAGEILAVCGVSGSGKTTLLSVLCGWEQPDRGRVEHGSGPVATLPWAELAIVPQSLALLEDLSVADNVALPARLTKVDRRRRCTELMERLEIAHLARRFPAQTSLGEQQRCAVARALVMRPALVLADEPTAHQDELRAATLLAAMRDEADAGAGFLLVSHHDQVLSHADQVRVMSDGALK
jgi:putative ABC transport system ATP-binding protein